MTENVLFECLKAGDGVSLEVNAKMLPQGGKRYKRARTPIPLEDLQALRCGEPTPEVIERVRETLSGWLHGNDLDLPVLLGFYDQDNEERWRIAYSLRKLWADDPKLFYELADLPIELIAPPDQPTAYTMHEKVASVVRYLPKAKGGGGMPVFSWPLRVLIVRSGPETLPEVPEAAPIRDKILELRPELGGNLRIDVLSSEDSEGLDGPPTRTRLLEQLKSNTYDVLVFVGHGDLHGEHVPPVGHLLLEAPDGHQDPLDGQKLATLLHRYEIPVVLLVGCLTAGDFPADILDQNLPRWLLGNHAVAQILINSQSNVQFAVGMRYRVDSDDATLFLKSFFESLLGANGNTSGAGDLEQAVRSARQDLDIAGKMPLSWAAPAIYRTEGEEPTFSFLQSPPVIEVDPSLKPLREIFWKLLARERISQRQSDDGSSSFEQALAALRSSEDEKLAPALKVASLLAPELRAVPAEEIRESPEMTVTRVTFSLRGSPAVLKLTGTVVCGSRVQIRALEATHALQAAGFHLLSEAAGGSRIRFSVESGSGEPAELPEGPLFEAEVAVGSEPGSVHSIATENLEATPEAPFAPLDNAILVSPP